MFSITEFIYSKNMQLLNQNLIFHFFMKKLCSAIPGCARAFPFFGAFFFPPFKQSFLKQNKSIKGKISCVFLYHYQTKESVTGFKDYIYSIFLSIQ